MADSGPTERSASMGGPAPAEGPATTGAVLITGCSTGIGRATALALHQAGYPVYASARRIADLAELAAQGISTLALDVTDEASMVAAVSAVEAEAGQVGVLINNAGYGLYGPVEQIPMAEVRRQFETNVFGLVRMTQLVLPGMRRARRGRILNISSMGGVTTLPGGAFYHASKHAVESFSDALRIEVAPFGVQVVLIEPGPVRTPWNDTAADSIGAAVSTPEDPYAEFKAAIGASFAQVTGGRMTRLVSTPEDVAEVIGRAVAADRPHTRYLINPVGRAMVAMKRFLPDRVHDAVLRQQYHLPR